MTWRLIRRMLLKPRFARLIRITYLNACVLAAYLGMAAPMAQGVCQKPLAARDIIDMLRVLADHRMIIKQITDCKVDPPLTVNDLNSIQRFKQTGDIIEALKPFVEAGEPPQPVAPPPEVKVAPSKEDAVPKRTTASSTKVKPNAFGTGASPPPKPAGEVPANDASATPTRTRPATNAEIDALMEGRTNADQGASSSSSPKPAGEVPANGTGATGVQSKTTKPAAKTTCKDANDCERWGDIKIMEATKEDWTLRQGIDTQHKNDVQQNLMEDWKWAQWYWSDGLQYATDSEQIARLKSKLSVNTGLMCNTDPERCDVTNTGQYCLNTADHICVPKFSF